MQILWSTSITRESFRFEDENKYEYEIVLHAFSKKDTPESFIYFFFTKKVCTVIYNEGGVNQYKPSPDCRRIKRLTFDNLSFTRKLVVG